MSQKPATFLGPRIFLPEYQGHREKLPLWARLFRRVGFVLAALYILAGLYFLVALDSPLGLAVWFAVKWLWLPLALLVWGGTALFRQALPRFDGSREGLSLEAFALFIVLIGLSGPWALALNTLGGERKPITYRGPILEKTEITGKSHQYLLTIRDEATAKFIRFSVSDSAYQNARVGQSFEESFSLGWIGLPYRWNHPLVTE